MLETDTQVPPETPAAPESRNRTSLVVGLVVAVALVVGVAIGWWLGSDDDDAADTDDPQQETATELVDTWAQGWGDGDAEAVTSVFAEDGVYVNWAGGRISRAEMPDHVGAFAGSLGDGDRVTELTRIDDGAYAWVHEMDWNGRATRGVLAIQLEDDLAAGIGWLWIDDPDIPEVFPAR